MSEHTPTRRRRGQMAKAIMDVAGAEIMTSHLALKCADAIDASNEAKIDALTKALQYGLDAVMESFDFVESNDDLLLAQARHQAITAALSSHTE